VSGPRSTVPSTTRRPTSWPPCGSSNTAGKPASADFVLASSSSVYGPDTPLPAEECATPCPQSPYALTKLHAEQWGQLYAQLHGLRFIALRFFSVWGPGQRPDLALEAFRRKIEAGQPVVINGDGSQRRDLTHVSDVARAVELALRWPGPERTSSTSAPARNHSVLDMLAAVTPPGSTPRIDYRPTNPADVPATLADIKSSQKELGWTPSASPSRTALSNEFRRTAIFRSEKHRQLYTFGGCTLHALHLRTPRFSVRERSPRKPQTPILQ
jgi:nucleoside-diphosphate-sugar epimerase